MPVVTGGEHRKNASAAQEQARLSIDEKSDENNDQDDCSVNATYISPKLAGSAVRYLKMDHASRKTSKPFPGPNRKLLLRQRM